jgi:hypothetical protein
VRYQWDFGDGSVAEGVTAVHTYAEAGQYTIRLTVTDDYGVSGLATRHIVVGCAPGNTAPWQVADIGESPLSGSAWFDGPDATGDLHLCTSGTRIGSTNDDGLFVYKEVSGDFRVVVPVKSVSHDGSGAATGVMVRTGLDANAVAGVTLLRDSLAASPRRIRFSCRPEIGGNMPTGSQNIADGGAPFWVRLERRGDTLTGSYSLDGIAWTEAGTQDIDGLPATLLAGVAACRGTSTAASGLQAMAAVAGNPEIVPLPAEARFRRGYSNGDGDRNIADAVFTLGYLFASDPAPTCMDAADANDDGAVNIADAVALLSHLFASSGALPAPFDACGADPTADGLGCTSFPASACAGP